jgi:hypothetical protein
MDAGLAGHVSAEFLRTLLTAVPIVVMAAVVLNWQSLRWQRLLWTRCALASTQARDDVTVQPRWCGWTLATEGVEIALVGGLAGCRWRGPGQPWTPMSSSEHSHWEVLMTQFRSGKAYCSD